MASRTRWFVVSALVAVALIAAAVAGVPRITRAASPAYAPLDRTFTVTMVPLQVHEMQGTLPFLKQDFAPGGVLYQKEVYGAYPSTLLVYQGDTVHLNIVNPEDDPHVIGFPGLAAAVTVKGQSSATLSFIARKPGLYTFTCLLPEHAPFMWGQIVVLPGSAAQ